MLTTALATSASTNVLTALALSLPARRGAATDATHLALLANPRAPALDTSAWDTLDTSDAVFALERPDLTASARAAILATGETLIRVAARSGPVTPAELSDAFATRKPTLSQALDLLLAPATPHNLAARAASAFHSSDNGPLAKLASTSIVEAGVARPGLTAAIDQYLAARADHPGLTWLAHRLAKTGNSGALRTVLAETTRDPRTAHTLLDAKNIGLVVNMRVDESIRLQALTADAAFRYAGSDTFRHLSDHGAVTAISQLPAPAQDAIAPDVLNNPHRSAGTLDAIFGHMYSASLDTAFPDPLVTLALHPHCPPDLRARVVVRADRHFRRPTLALMLDPEKILEVPFSDLRANHAPTAFLAHHIAAALTAQNRTVTPDQARTIALLEPTFAGTPRELLATATSIST